MGPSRRRRAALSLACAAALFTAFTTGQARAQERAGGGFINFGGGPTIYLDDSVLQGHVMLQAGLQVSRRVALSLSPTVAFGRGFEIITLPLGIEYDIHIRGTRNLYVYPKLNVGGAMEFVNGGGSAGFFTIIPELGLKYVIDHSFNIAVEPVSFPIYVGDRTFAAYRMTFLLGFTF